MRPSFFAALVLCVTFCTAAMAPAQAKQSSFAALTTANGPTTPATNPEAIATATTVIIGHVKTAAGPLAGAVIKIAKSEQMVVTDADGSFHVTVPAANGLVEATASYAGFADERVTLDATSSEVSMSVVRIVKVVKKQQLKTYLKTARKQVRKSLRSARS